MSKKVLVLGEAREGALRNVSYESIAAAKQVSNGGEVVAVLLGDAVQDLAAELGKYGADRVITVEHPHLKQYTSDGYGQAFMAVVDQEKPEAIAFVVIWVLAFVFRNYLDKIGVDLNFPILMWRTKKLRGFIDKIANLFP